MSHRLPVRVYYEDTDMGGIVYYANYLKYIERARSELVEDMGLDQKRMKDEDGIVFVVRRVEADYLAPARLDDIAQTSETAVFFDSARIHATRGFERIPWGFPTVAGQPSFHGRHDGVGNIGFADGHVAQETPAYYPAYNALVFPDYFPDEDRDLGDIDEDGDPLTSERYDLR